MHRIYLDFETYSEVDLKECGVYRYTRDPSFHPWCAVYALDDGPLHLWVYDTPIPPLIDDVMSDPNNRMYAFNAEFEWNVMRQAEGWRDVAPDLTQMVDIQALAGTFGYPIHLDGFCKAVGLPVAKDPMGKRLIKKLCVPQKKTAFNPDGKWTPETAPEDFKKFYAYCLQDVDIMRKAVKRLPREYLTAFEQVVWGHTVEQNERGFSIDAQTVRSICLMLGATAERGEAELARITNGAVTTGKQIDRICAFLITKGVYPDSLSAENVQALLDNRGKLGVPPVAVRVLELRQLLASSSVAKFAKMLRMMDKYGRIRGNLKYFGAHTGRFAGTGVQIHNLPRAKHDNPEEAVADFRMCDIDFLMEKYGDVNKAASKLIRPCIVPKTGNKFVVGDYKSIENVVLHWMAGDTVTTEEFRQGLDQYKTYAAARFKVPYDKVTKAQRQYAKPCILGLGYGGGTNALIYVAEGYGLQLDAEQAAKDVAFYRAKYPKIPKLWYGAFGKAQEAVTDGGPTTFGTGTARLEFRCAGGYLFVLLPSGRRLVYPEVAVNSSWRIMIGNQPRKMEAGLSYMGVRNNQWMRIGVHPGQLIENVVQALARDVMVYGALCAEEAGYPVVATVHDEIISEVEDVKTKDLSTFLAMMCTLQPWAKTIPISAEGYEGYRYKKD